MHLQSLVVIGLLLGAQPARAVQPAPAEFALCRQGTDLVFLPGGRDQAGEAASRAAAPWAVRTDWLGAFSAQYGGTSTAELLPTWNVEFRRSARQDGAQRAVLIQRDSLTGLEITTELREFADFPAVEWVVHLKNTRSTNTPILHGIQALDRLLPVPAAGQTVLHWAKGAVASFDDFAPQRASLKPGATLRLKPGGGRSSSEVLPFFNLEGAGGGVILAVGWSGEWAAEFSAGTDGEVRMRAGLDHTHLVLHPGESIRTPRMLLLCYQGDRWRGQNLLRQFLLAHHRPRRAGQPLVAPVTCGNWGGTRAEVHLDNIAKIIEHRLPVDYYWIDAEWFGQGNWPVSVGNWQVKPHLYPQGFKPLSDRLRQAGRELMLWFEPERVYRGTTWHQAHPDWLIDLGRDSLLFNLGNPEARMFLTDFISQRVSEFGLGCYRQDFNMEPLLYWKAADAPDRQGISEIRHIEGLYAFWDELQRRHPSLLIDNCASGGRRIDLETVGRATPYWRTDGPRDPVAHQCHTYGLLPWVPLSATSQDRAGDDYEFRGSMCSSLCLNWWVSGDVPAERIPDSFPFDWARRTLEQYLSLRAFYYGDFYPLTAYSQDKSAWMAYQLDRPDTANGLLVILRRPESPYEVARLRLQALEQGASYDIVDLDSQALRTVTGKELGAEGLPVSLSKAGSGALIRYERK